jgi:Ca2+ transporting ATPase
VIGAYVGVATAAGFLWWYLSFAGGPRLTWRALTSFQKCAAAAAAGAPPAAAAASPAASPAAAAAAAGVASCEVFSDLRPRTLAMSVLVVVEMFNAFNNISENSSLLAIPPWDNAWLVGAVATSIALHLLIMYARPLAALFGITGLGAAEWRAVLALSAPVILVDEALKAASRRRGAGRGGRWGLGGGGGGGPRGEREMLLPLGAITVVAPGLASGGGSNAALAADKSH